MSGREVFLQNGFGGARTGLAPDAILSARRITKRYGSVLALSEVDIDIAPGEIVALAGENGSGKSTLSRILAGGIAADDGVVLVEGKPRRVASPRVALDEGVALVSQEPTAVPDLTVGENVTLPLLRRPAALFNRRAIHASAEQYLRQVGLNVDPRTPLASLRAGERELVEIAKALATRPRVLILDEATARLPDPARLFDLIRQLSENGVATLFISHRLREVEKLAHRAVVLRDGRMTGELRPPRITGERLSRMMVGRELGGFFGHRPAPHDAVALELDDVLVEGTDTPVKLTVRRGEIVGLSGLIGAGRTELLETIIGIRGYRGGTIRVAGAAVRAGSVRAALEAGLALVPEDRVRQGLLASASVRENIAMGTHRVFGAARRRSERERAGPLVRSLGIRPADPEVPAANLSGGNQQKVVLARSLLRDPKVLLLDEPTRGLDVGAKADVYHVVSNLVARGVAVLVASSEMIELLGLCDRIIVMYQRGLVAALGREEATEERIALLSGGG